MTAPDDDIFQECFSFLPSQRGCALLGKTDFDKLEAVKNFLAKRGVTECDGKNDMEDCFIVYDCRHKARREPTLAKIAAKYRDTPYVIFNNCERIFTGGVIKMFAHLLDKYDHSESWRFRDSGGKFEQFSTSSFYVFIGEENRLPKQSDFPLGSAEQDRIQSFCTYIHCYDFNLNGWHFG